MLARLKARHAALESALETLERLARKATPDRAQVASARLALSQASAQRTRCLNDDVFPKILAANDLAASETVRALRTEGAQLRARSAEHVAAWNIDRAIDDWPGYCRASAELRAIMRDRLRRERTLLYPLLD
jgi:hypothetical protein